MKPWVFFSLIALALLLLVKGAPCSAQTYDGETAFSLTNGNPNGIWSYASSSSLDSPQSLYIYTNVDNGYTNGFVEEWGTMTGAIPIPLVGENPTAFQAGVWPPNTLGFHPGYFGDFSHVVWTCPIGGVYAVNVTFTMVGGGNTEVYAVQRSANDSTNYLAQGNVSAPNTNYTYTGTVIMNPGDELDFAVGWGNGELGADTTALSPVITFISGLAPQIISQPQSQIVPVGYTASFVVGATSPLPFSFQWQMNGSNLVDGGNISGSATTNLVVANLTTLNAGLYDLIVSNADGSVTSSLTTLTVIPPPPPVTYAFTDLHDFDGTNGAQPSCLVQGDDGNLYGCADAGGVAYPSSPGSGTIFKLSPSGASFANIAMFPFNYMYNQSQVVGFVKGPDGNFYGATGIGGPYTDSYAEGTIFRVTPGGNFTDLEVFGMSTNSGFLLGSEPLCLILGKDGNLYGTLTHPPYTAPVQENGLNLFEMTADVDYTFLYADTNHSGASSAYSMVQDNEGNFYSIDPATNATGHLVLGIEKITSDYQETQMLVFSANVEPNDELIIGNDGNIYGTTFQYGAVFRMTPDDNAVYLANVAYPNCIIQASDGNFYGTTYYAGTLATPGTVFKMTPSGYLTTIVTLPNNTQNGWSYGSNPTGMPDLLQGTDGNLYGLARFGGAYDQGMIYRVSFVPNLGVTTAPLIGNTVILSWSGLAGQTCQVQYKTNLQQTAWTDLGSPVVSSGSYAIFTDNTGSSSQRFYRLVVSQ